MAKKENVNKANKQSSKDAEILKGIQLTDIHLLSYDKYQFKLYTKIAPKDFDGNWENINFSSNSLTYHPTILNALRWVDIDECKIVLEAYYKLKDFDKQFQKLLKEPHDERLKNADVWFSQFKLNEDTMELYNKKCKECDNLRKENRKLKGLSDEEDAVADVNSLY